MCKGTLRFSMAMGLVTGNFAVNQVNKIKRKLEALNEREIQNRVQNQLTENRIQVQRNYPRNPQGMANPLRLISILALSLTSINSLSCNSNNIITGQVTTCEENALSHSCKISTQAKLTLQNLDYSACLTIKDEHGNHLASLTINYKKLPCKWATSRKYYTFLVEMNQVAGLACPQNRYCGWGDHCRRDTKFESLTEESLVWPGITDCIAGDSGSICHIVDSQSCLIYRWYLKPKIIETYEVRTIHGYTCTPIIQLTFTEGRKTEVRTSTTTTYLHNNTIGVYIEGTYHQPSEILTKSLVVGHFYPNDGDLEDVAPQGRLQYGAIGDVQADKILTKKFIFDEKMVTCSFYEDQLTCKHTKSYLETLIKEKTNKLPRTLHVQEFFINFQNELESEMHISSPVILHLDLSNYQVTLHKAKICPKLVKIKPVIGCYSCDTPATIPIIAKSTCSIGIVEVKLEGANLLTGVINLTKADAQYEIKIQPSTKCISQNLCLMHKYMESCELIQFCLEEPLISLHQPNVSIEISQAKTQSGDSFWSNLWNPLSIFSALSFGKFIYIGLGILAAIFSCHVYSIYLNLGDKDRKNVLPCRKFILEGRICWAQFPKGRPQPFGPYLGKSKKRNF